MYVLNVGTKFPFCSNIYMITKSKIDAKNLGLFILSHVFINPKQLVAFILFCGPFYSQSNYLIIVKFKYSISMYSMWMNIYAYENFTKKILLYSDGCS